LIDAVDTFNPARGVTFETYCSYRVRGAILDAVREMDWVPRLVRSRARQLAEAEQILANRFGCIPTDCELAHQLDVTSQRLASMRSDDRGAKLVSLNDLTSAPSGSSVGDREIETISDEHCEDVAERTLRTEFKEVVLASLSKTEQLVIKMYYYDGNTMAEVGRRLDLSESRVSQIHTSIIARLRARAAREDSQDSRPALSYGNWRSGKVAFEPSKHPLAA
jgi:RNA polymerase sigma factor for flagellar operon FliA